ncbi:PEP/pyruvate-binding domain-containing protein [Nocardioides sp. URHA0020]|uniref:PEP/pyruvate-binding domain-containing protein n=1 Tax=Nocardioides sp. URHA0020 TaxID=1380392 RepID=UPI00048F7A81|nr:PEP/pyruvate-binding domain-containing protein [Nocardioides sp. URHA0020]
MTSLTCELVELSDVVDARYGGKALGLAELSAAGFAVPAAFVIANADADALPADLPERFARLVADGTVATVAVRSSAAGEDGVDSSFAGQYETVLGVSSYDELIDAVRRCVASTGSERATAYQAESGVSGTMHLVVQEMVDARSAGVVFTADPTSARRDLAVVDAVAGLGEALVDGSTTSDHFEVDRAGTITDRQVTDMPAITDDEVTLIAAGAREAEARWGRPLDLEWAIDADGRLRWLQARPITTLPGDLSAMDSVVGIPDDVYTRCNIGEMMPGAFCPLTASVSGRAIEYAMQMVQVKGGFQRAYDEARWLQVGYFSGHLFLNMTEGTALSSGILGNSLEQYSISIAGRVVDELVPKPPKPFPRRLVNTVKLTTFALSAGPHIRRLDRRLATFEAPSAATPEALLAELDAAIELYNEATLTHVRSSSRSAVAANVLEDTVVKEAVKAGRTEDEGRARASALMAGATDVESAVMLAQLDEVVADLAADEQAGSRFLELDAAAAVGSLTDGSGTTTQKFNDFLERHGHRGYRELCVRDPSWGDDPEGLGTIMQAMLRARIATGNAARPTQAVDDADLPRALRSLARMARAGARGREATKSRMVLVAHRLSRGYRLLGEQLAAIGRLPDADLVFFLDRSELPAVVGSGDVSGLVAAAQSRRTALPFQARLEFPDVTVGKPVPFRPQPPEGIEDGVIVGRPACSGVVEGAVRVATTIAEAQALQPGEILVAPVTDVGWTPYFTLIAALVTDIGSSVSHGAVVAREYGLPCVVNTQGATRVLRTGDRVRVDGDRGTVTIL